MSGAADVIVTDGFTGNVALKLIEGVSQAMLGAIRDVAMASTRGQPAGAAARRRCGSLREEIDPERRAAPTCSACASSA